MRNRRTAITRFPVNRDGFAQLFECENIVINKGSELSTNPKEEEINYLIDSVLMVHKKERRLATTRSSE
jgi:hypothetical protein